MNTETKDRSGERGSAGVKLFACIVVIAMVAHAALNYIPVAYSAESVKSDMATAVLQGLALPGKLSPTDNVKTRIEQSALRNDLPPDVFIDVQQKGTSLTARVVYDKQVNILPFGIYTYKYHFDHTATPAGFLIDQAPKSGNQPVKKPA